MSACPDVCPPDLARAGERCADQDGHAEPHLVPIDEINAVGSAWFFARFSTRDDMHFREPDGSVSTVRA